MIRCGCLTPHPEHEFAATDSALLCARCAHNLAAHVPVPIADHVVGLLRIYDIEGWQISSDREGVVLTLRLTPPRKADT